MTFPSSYNSNKMPIITIHKPLTSIVVYTSILLLMQVPARDSAVASEATSAGWIWKKCTSHTRRLVKCKCKNCVNFDSLSWQYIRHRIMLSSSHKNTRKNLSVVILCSAIMVGQNKQFNISMGIALSSRRLLFNDGISERTYGRAYRQTRAEKIMRQLQ